MQTSIINVNLTLLQIIDVKNTNIADDNLKQLKNSWLMLALMWVFEIFFFNAVQIIWVQAWYESFLVCSLRELINMKNEWTDIDNSEHCSTDISTLLINTEV